MTQADLARASGLSYQLIWKYENQPNVEPSAKCLLSLAAVLEANPEWLLHGTGPQFITEVTSTRADLISDLDKLSPEKELAVAAMVKAMLGK